MSAALSRAAPGRMFPELKKSLNESNRVPKPRSQHGGAVFFRRIVRVWNRGLGVLSNPLVRTGGAFREFPFVLEQVLQVVIAQLGRRLGPGHFQAAGDGVAPLARAEGALPAEALLLEAGCFRFGSRGTGFSPTPSPKRDLDGPWRGNRIEANADSRCYENAHSKPSPCLCNVVAPAAAGDGS